MNKIRDLMLKANCKPELVDQICESLESYKTTVREQFEADYAAKVEQAKKVCIEETETHKRELSRRLQIFLETKNAGIDASMQRQAAMNESEAVTKLKNLKNLLEGVQVEQNGAAMNGQVPAVIEKAKQKIQKLTEERDQAIALANQRNAIAEKALGNNRKLVSENMKLKVAIQGNGKAPVVENRTPANRSQRIDGGRKSTQPTTSRPTIVENQDRRPAPQGNPGQTRVAGTKTGIGITDIASQMDEDLI